MRHDREVSNEDKNLERGTVHPAVSNYRRNIDYWYHTQAEECKTPHHHTISRFVMRGLSSLFLLS